MGFLVCSHEDTEFQNFLPVSISCFPKVQFPPFSWSLTQEKYPKYYSSCNRMQLYTKYKIFFKTDLHKGFLKCKASKKTYNKDLHKFTGKLPFEISSKLPSNDCRCKHTSSKHTSSFRGSATRKMQEAICMYGKL